MLTVRLRHEYLVHWGVLYLFISTTGVAHILWSVPLYNNSTEILCSSNHYALKG